MRLSGRANVWVAAVVAVVLAVAFLGYRFTQYGQVSAPIAGAPAKVDQKPPDAYKPTQ